LKKVTMRYPADRSGKQNSLIEKCQSWVSV
jgi:hypothetical protein